MKAAPVLAQVLYPGLERQGQVQIIIHHHGCVSGEQDGAPIERHQGPHVPRGVAGEIRQIDGTVAERIFGVDCDVLLPAALGDVLTRETASEVRARIVLEGANGPTSPEADEILRGKGVLVVPDILANAGGVTVSYFEWVQNIQQFRWSEVQVNTELEKIMRKSYKSVSRLAREKKLPLRTAAFIIGIGRVGRARVQRGL